MAAPSSDQTATLTSLANVAAILSDHHQQTQQPRVRSQPLSFYKHKHKHKHKQQQQQQQQQMLRSRKAMQSSLVA
jgi:hypothetical protein